MIQHPDLFTHADRYPAAPAIGKTDTSRAAADLIKSRHTLWQEMVYAEIARNPCNWKEASVRLGLDSRLVQPRFSELKTMGDIEDSGVRRDRCAVMRIKQVAGND